MKTWKNFDTENYGLVERYATQKKALENIVNKFSKILNEKYNETNELGLLPEKIRLSTEYKKDYSNFQKAFNNLRAFNSKLDGKELKAINKFQREKGTYNND